MMNSDNYLLNMLVLTYIAFRMARPKKVTENVINVKWFKDQISKKGLSERKVAKLLDVSPTTLSHTWSGRIHIRLDHIDKWAEILGVSPQDVLNNSGIKLPDFLKNEALSPTNSSLDNQKLKNCEIKGYVNGQMDVIWGDVIGPKTISNPILDQNIGEIEALRCQTSGSIFDSMDGSLMFYHKTNKPFFDPEAIGRVCLVSLNIDGQKKYLLRVVKRGYVPGRHNLCLINGQLLEESVQVESAIPILLMKF